MKTEVVRIGELQEGDQIPEAILRAGEIIKRGGLVAFPTETVYGLGGDAFDETAGGRIYAAKGRPQDNPLIVHIADAKDLHRVAQDIPEAAFTLAEAFWPGPLTMVLRKRPEVPDSITGGLDTVAVRLPGLKSARALITAAGGFVAAPSANKSGRPSPTTAEHCVVDLDGQADMILDGGSAVLGLESTVIDLTVTPPVILRPGFVTAEAIGRILGTEVGGAAAIDDRDETAPKAPGMKYRHYAPAGIMTVVSGDESRVQLRIRELSAEDRARGSKTGIICATEHAEEYDADVILEYGHVNDAERFAAALFAHLRTMDAQGVERIYAEGIPDEGVGGALMNRLLKAAGGNHIEL